MKTSRFWTLQLVAVYYKTPPKSWMQTSYPQQAFGVTKNRVTRVTGKHLWVFL